MRNDIKNKLVEYGKTDLNIESIFCIESQNDNYFNDIYLVVGEVIISKLEKDLLDILDDVILQNRVKKQRKIDKKELSYTQIDIFRKDNLKLSVSVIQKDLAGDFMKSLPTDISFIYNNPVFEGLSVNEYYRVDKIKEYDFMSTIKNFFSKSMETSFYLLEDNRIASLMKLEEVRADLAIMLDFSVRDKTQFKKDSGSDYQYLEDFLDADSKKNFLETFSTADSLAIYDSLFKACGLFRKLSMKLGEDSGYEYPREIDVETMKLLRDNYHKLRAKQY